MKTKESETPEKKLQVSELILLDSMEFASLFRISARTAYEWRRDGVVPFIRIQGRIYYRLSDVLNSLEIKFKNKSKIQDNETE